MRLNVTNVFRYISCIQVEPQHGQSPDENTELDNKILLSANQNKPNPKCDITKKHKQVVK